MREYDASDPLSIFAYSGGLLDHTLAEILPYIDENVDIDTLDREGKGGLGTLVEKHFFGYEPNSNPEPDFPAAGVELKVSPLKKNRQSKLIIKERLVCDMIDYFALTNETFEDSRFFKKSMLMLIIFYLHINGCPKRDLRFIYSVLWLIKDKDLLIIKDDFRIIQDKVRQGLAHKISEGDTMYLGACRKGYKGQSSRKQPFSDELAPARAFSLKPAYMRSILEFVEKSRKSMASNMTETEMPGIELVSAVDLMKDSFESILQKRFEPFLGMDYKQISDKLGIKINPSTKSKFSIAARNILHCGLKSDEGAEELRKAGIKIKTIRLQKNGTTKEHLSFEGINYQEVFETNDWIESKWYEIITTRYMFIVFREVEDERSAEEPRYILDKMFFWTMPASDYPVAEAFWQNIKENVMADTLLGSDGGKHANTFWRLKDHKYFHVRPKARNSEDVTYSPISNTPVPKKAYWFDNRYIRKELIDAYGDDWDKLFNTTTKK